MKTKLRLCSIAIAASLAITPGCANLSQNQAFNNENLGTIVGAAAGALLGSQIGKGSGQTVAILAGAIAGGVLGKAIGARLDQRDRQALAIRSQQVLDGVRDGQVTTWRSDHSGASARIVPVSTEKTTRPVSVKRTARVQAPGELQMLNSPYRAIKSANVRGAPDANAEKVGGLSPGSTFTAIGRTDNNWIAVGRRGVTVGYVFASLVEPASRSHQAARDSGTVATPTPRGTTETATDLDAMDVSTAKDQGFDLDTVQVIEDRVAATTTCRTLKYTVTTEGRSDQQNVKACQGADGAWELG